jgi:glycosyltransferase involved in cell wall biosynthesis
MRTLDVIVPVFNEAQGLPAFYERLASVLNSVPFAWRILFINDGSSDATLAVCESLRARDPRVGVINLSRNFGHQAALTAGLDQAEADVVVMMDGDLQHPPDIIPTFIKAWEEGAEIVQGVRGQAADLGLVKRLTSRTFYRIMNVLSDVPIVPDAPDFRLIDARVVSAVRELREQTRFMRGIFAWIGFKQVRIPYDEAARTKGESKFGMRTMIKFAKNGVLGFSTLPLRAAGAVGGWISLLAFAYGLYAAAQRIIFDQALPGWSSLAILISFLSGAQMLFIGVIGEYLGQALSEARGRPLYVVSSAKISQHDGERSEN